MDDHNDSGEGGAPPNNSTKRPRRSRVSPAVRDLAILLLSASREIRVRAAADGTLTAAAVSAVLDAALREWLAHYGKGEL